MANRAKVLIGERMDFGFCRTAKPQFRKCLHRSRLQPIGDEGIRTRFRQKYRMIIAP